MAKTIEAEEFVLCATNERTLYPAFCALARLACHLSEVEAHLAWRRLVDHTAFAHVARSSYGNRNAIRMTAAELKDASEMLRGYYARHIAE